MLHYFHEYNFLRKFLNRKHTSKTFDAKYIVVKNLGIYCNKFARNQPRQRFSPPSARPVMSAKTRRYSRILGNGRAASTSLRMHVASKSDN